LGLTLTNVKYIVITQWICKNLSVIWLNNQ
jgi:hypothetical protein